MKEYDWDNVQKYYNSKKSARETIRYFGMSSSTWHKARVKGKIKTIKKERMGIPELLIKAKRRSYIRERLIEEGFLKNQCSICRIKSWLDKKLVLQLDHIDGNGKNNSLKNLRLLCPNCHSQTDTFSGRNKKINLL